MLTYAGGAMGVHRGGDYYRPGNGSYYRPQYHPNDVCDGPPPSHGRAPWVTEYAMDRPAYTHRPPTPPEPFQMTCRGWLGGWCRQPQWCSYAHRETPFLSPPQPYTCWFWSRGHCTYSAERCPYAHSWQAMAPLRPRSFGTDREQAPRSVPLKARRDR